MDDGYRPVPDTDPPDSGAGVGAPDPPSPRSHRSETGVVFDSTTAAAAAAAAAAASAADDDQSAEIGYHAPLLDRDERQEDIDERDAAEALFFDLLGRPPGLPPQRDDRLAEALEQFVSRRDAVRADSRAQHYLADFVEDVRDDAFLMGTIAEPDVAAAEEAVTAARRQITERRERLYDDRRRVTFLRTEQALAREREQHQTQMEREAELDRRRELLLQRQRDDLRRAFATAERQLNAALGERLNDMSQLYGPFRTVREQTESSKIDWDAMPQRTRVTIKMLRAVRDKLPHGRYVVMCTLYDHMGGHPLPLSKMRTQSVFQRKPGRETTQCEQTTPVNFPADEGAVNATVEMRFDCDLHFVCPSKHAIRPSMVLLFEVVLLAPAEDVTVGWGVFPLCDALFNIPRGFFKTPLLRGAVDLSIDKHATFAKRFMEDLDNWLVNLYFAIQPEDRITAQGVREHELELMHTSRLLGHPPRHSETSTRTRLRAGDSSGEEGEAAGRHAASSGTESDSDSDETVPWAGGGGGESSSRRLRAAPLTPGQEMEKYHFALGDSGGYREHSEMYRKFQYIKREALTEFGLSNPRTLEFYGALFFILFNFWFRLYVHYVGEWLMCRMIGVPVYIFKFLPHTVLIIYTPEVISRVAESAIVMAGPIFLIFLLLMFVFLAWAWQKASAVFPELASRFIMTFGVAVMADPFLILITDCAMKYWTGDLFKLYNKFYYEDGTGGAVIGVILTVLIYLALEVVALFIMYRYILYIHLNGRMLDVYQRVLGDESAFFVPQDLELSLNEVRWICERAERWRGPAGQRRKVFVFEVDVTDPQDPTFHEQTIHIGVFEMDRNIRKRPRVYRHLLRLPEGHIVEVLKDPKKGLLLGSDDTRHLMTRNHRVRFNNIGEVGALLERNF